MLSPFAGRSLFQILLALREGVLQSNIVRVASECALTLSLFTPADALLNEAQFFTNASGEGHIIISKASASGLPKHHSIERDVNLAKALEPSTEVTIPQQGVTCRFPTLESLSPVQRSLFENDGKRYRSLTPLQTMAFLNFTAAIPASGISLDGAIISEVRNDRIIFDANKGVSLLERVILAASEGNYIRTKPSKKRHRGMADWEYRQNKSYYALQVGGANAPSNPRLEFFDVDIANPVKGFKQRAIHGGEIFWHFLTGGRTCPYQAGQYFLKSGLATRYFCEKRKGSGDSKRQIHRRR